MESTRIGHKAATLVELSNAGFTTPPSEVVDADALSDWAAGSPAPQSVLERVDEIIARFGARTPLAVRSSAINEDGPDSSYAGMYTTTLGVVGKEQVIAAIESCLSSTLSARVQTYRGGKPPPMAVLVQPLLTPDVAGIAFTADPVSGDRVVRVSGVKGIADQVASGLVTPDEWEVRDGTASRLGEAGARALSRQQVLAVAEVAIAVEQHFGRPQDLEWALVDDEVIVLQARDITALPVPPKQALDGVNWEKDVAHCPEPITPFGAALYEGADIGPVAEMARTYGLIIDGMETRIIGGEVYVRIVPLIGSPDSSAKPPPALILGLAARLHPKLAKRMKAAKNAFESGLLEEWPRRWNEVERSRFVSRIEDFLDVDLAGLDDQALIDEYERIHELGREGSHIHFQLFIPYLVGLHQLCKFTEDKLGWSVEETLVMLQSPASDATKGLEAIRRRVAEEPRVRNSLAAMPSDPVGVLERTAPDLAAQLSAWLRREGWRTVSYDPGSPVVGERPGMVTRLLLRQTRENLHDRTEAIERARSLLKPEDLGEFDSLFAYASYVYPIREDNVVLTDNAPSGLMRRWLVEASRRLLERGLISRLDDGSFLEPNEIHRALVGEASDLQDVIARRKGEWAWTRAHPGPVRVGEASATPDVSRLPKAARMFNEAILWGIQHEYPANQGSSGEDGGLGGAAGSPGVYRGPARVIRGEADMSKLMDGEVMVCPVTTPAWSSLFAIAGAVVTDNGGVLSHAAIVAREHGIPAVLGTRSATQEIGDGDYVEVDGTNGVVAIIERRSVGTVGQALS